MLYRNLAMRLNAEHAVYGLQPNSRPDVPMAHSRIADMAAYHIGKIRSVQPHGPYLLGGTCAGGVIAFEIARQLQGQREKVALVALLDAADVAAPLKTWRVAGQRLQRFSGVFRAREPELVWLYHRVIAILGKVVRKVVNTGIYNDRRPLQTGRGTRVRMRLFRANLDRSRPLPKRLRNIPVRTVYLFAEADYRPDGPFIGELALFRATSGVGA